MKEIHTWQCDHCNTQGPKELIKEHELKGCVFNPKRNHCYTCKFHDQWPDGSFICQKEHRTDEVDGIPGIKCEFHETKIS